MPGYIGETKTPPIIHAGPNLSDVAHKYRERVCVYVRPSFPSHPLPPGTMDRARVGTSSDDYY